MNPTRGTKIAVGSQLATLGFTREGYNECSLPGKPHLTACLPIDIFIFAHVIEQP